MKSSQKLLTKLHLAVKMTRGLFVKMVYTLWLMDTTKQNQVEVVCLQVQLEALL